MKKDKGGKVSYIQNIRKRKTTLIQSTCMKTVPIIVL